MSEEITAADPAKFADETPELAKAICPHCSADPLLPAFRVFNIGPMRAVCWFCSACRKAVPIFMLPAKPNQRSVIIPHE